MEQRICVDCAQKKDITYFNEYKCSNGRIYRRRLCVECFPKHRTVWQKKYKDANRDKFYIWNRERVERNREKIGQGNKARVARLRDMIHAAYGGAKCVCCGETETSMLTLDHINEDGAQHRRLLAEKTGVRPEYCTGGKTYRDLRDRGFPPGYQVLCFNCNISKHRNRGVCAHKIKRAPA